MKAYRPGGENKKEMYCPAPYNSMGPKGIRWAALPYPDPTLPGY